MNKAIWSNAASMNLTEAVAFELVYNTFFLVFSILPTFLLGRLSPSPYMKKNHTSWRTLLSRTVGNCLSKGFEKEKTE
ncbi:hypothetical protein SAMN04488057_10669 [Cyclobacterium lianum]|uniref:Uncharacterized protein n=1 Tax=Cyclobacterium lianum TaxID=388280 RepID=A0A1M7NTT1_9BACT|nr:hypothetical protein SAMN04488057_10669 [Cyclobacterium lianum]